MDGDIQSHTASWLHAVPRPFLWLLAVGCVAMGAMMAGLTLGLMSLDMFQLELLAVSGTTVKEREAARAIAPLRARGNQLLVTLILMNTVANELLPLVLDVLYPGGYLALVLSVVSVVLFGEVLPQAVSSRYALQVGAASAGFTRVLLMLFQPVAWPMAWGLDKLLGKELRTGYDRDRLKALIQMHGPTSSIGVDLEASGGDAGGRGSEGETVPSVEQRGAVGERDPLLPRAHSAPQGAAHAAASPTAAATSPTRPTTGGPAEATTAARTWSSGGAQAGSWERPYQTGTDVEPSAQPPESATSAPRRGFGVLSADEAHILLGALELSSKKVTQIMTPAKDVFSLSVDERLDRQLLKRILRRGHSRIPIYDGERANVVAILLVKQLLLVDPDEALPIRSIIRRKKRSHKKKVVSPVYVSQECNLLDLFNEFQVGRSHMAIVVESLDRPEDGAQRKLLGIVTLEDIMEEIIMEEVLDETDVYVDNRSHRPLLVKGRDHKWHYSIPDELLASRQRDPQLIRYRDIDEEAYAGHAEGQGEDVRREASESAVYEGGEGDRRTLSTSDAAMPYGSSQSASPTENVVVAATGAAAGRAAPTIERRGAAARNAKSKVRRRAPQTTAGEEEGEEEKEPDREESVTESDSNEYLEYDFEVGTYVDPPSMLSAVQRSADGKADTTSPDAA